MNSPAGDDGTFTVAGLRALQGDTVSMLIDNNGIRQVAYVTLNASRTEQMTVATLVPSTDPKYKYAVAEKTETVILQTDRARPPFRRPGPVSVLCFLYAALPESSQEKARKSF